MSWPPSYMLPYFEVKWDGVTAGEAFNEGKAAAIRNLHRQIAEVEALTFDQFKQRCLHHEVLPGTVRGKR